MKRLLLERGKLILVLAIIALGFFLRSYHFSDWLHFELDQSRDARVISDALENGPGNLTLLGPRAGGTFLRLGPLFYYFQYAGGIIFGNNPSGIAMATLIFSIGSLFVFYLFCREYFSKALSILLLSIFSTSLFFVMYSRFAWNPNSLPFFELFAFYSLLRTTRKEEKKKGIWLIVFFLSLTIATQLHFLALLSLPLIGLAYLIIKRPKVPWRFWVISASVVIFLYSPVILNETKTGGANFKEFKKAISGKSDSEGHSILASVAREYQEQGLASWLILTGNEKGTPLKVGKNPSGFPVTCGSDCRKDLPYTMAALAIFTLGVVLLIKNFVFQRDSEKRNFILLNSLWFLCIFVMYVPLAFDLSPRFFLLIGPVYLVFLGFGLEVISGLKRGLVVIAIAALFVASNLFYTYQRFRQMAVAKTENVEIEPDRILKERARVTLSQEMAIADYVKSEYEKNSLPVNVKSDAQYDRAFKYLLERNVPVNDFSSDGPYKPGNYFLIWRTSSDVQSKNSKYLAFFDVVESKSFGTLTVFYLTPKEEFLDLGPAKKSESKSPSKVPKRYTWNEFFSSQAGESEDTNSEEESLMQKEGL
jgi:4-amino-4-deoxy-L-arabinose transferase-like glycosyltransferase